MKFDHVEIKIDRPKFVDAVCNFQTEYINANFSINVNSRNMHKDMQNLKDDLDSIFKEIDLLMAHYNREEDYHAD